MERDTEHICVRADKSRSIYKISVSEYDLIFNKLIDNYKIDYNNTSAQIYSDIVKFTDKLDIKDRLGKLKVKSACILFKYHK